MRMESATFDNFVVSDLDSQVFLQVCKHGVCVCVCVCEREITRKRERERERGITEQLLIILAGSS